jgi:hypothetical protein
VGPQFEDIGTKTSKEDRDAQWQAAVAALPAGFLGKQDNGAGGGQT